MATLKTRDVKCDKCEELFKTVGSSKRRLCDRCSVKRHVKCRLCKAEFTFCGRSGVLYCPTCRRVKNSKSVMKARALKNPAVKVGVGSGGNQHGKSNHAWNPHSRYHGVGRVDCIAARGLCQVVWAPCCVICGSDHKLQAHHIDGNWRDCRLANVIPLCTSCHHKVHRGAIPERTPEALIASLFKMWPGGRNKIVEKIWNPLTWESEVKARRNGWVSRNDYLLKPETEYNEGTRPRDAQASKDSLSLQETARSRG